MNEKIRKKFKINKDDWDKMSEEQKIKKRRIYCGLDEEKTEEKEKNKQNSTLINLEKNEKEVKQNNDYDPDFMGFINLHRKIIYSSVFSDAQTLQLFLYCLARANWENKEIILKGGEIIKLERGQFISSIKKMAKACNSTSRKIRTRTKTLILTHRLTIKTTSKYSLITVLNYNNHQSMRQSKRQGNRQTNDKPTTTDKNYNNYNNKKENTKRKKNLIYDFLPKYKKQFFEKKPEFLKYKLTSPSNFERILTYFYVFEGYNFKDKWELFEQIKGDKGYYERDLQIIAKHADPVILQAMANLSEKGSFKLNECAGRLSARQGKQSDKIDGVKADLADKMAM